MKFCYCPDCKELHPKNWYGGRTCERCRGTCSVIVVPASVFGYLMYFFTFLALIMIGLYLMRNNWALSDLTIPLLFLAIAGSFVCSFIEIGRGTKLAYEKIQKQA